VVVNIVVVGWERWEGGTKYETRDEIGDEGKIR